MLQLQWLNINSLDDLDSLNLDETIENLRSNKISKPELVSTSENENKPNSADIITQIKQQSSIDALERLFNENYDILKENGVLELVEEKLCLLENQGLVEKQCVILENISEFEINVNDKFGQQFFFESDIGKLCSLCEDVIEFNNIVANSRYQSVALKISGLALEKNLLNQICVAMLEKIDILKKAFISLLKSLIGTEDWSESTSAIVNIEDIITCSQNFNMVQNVYVIINKYSKKSANDSYVMFGLSDKIDAIHQDGVWSSEVVLQPIITKFIYHFYGKSLTNKINQPELAIEFFLSYINDDEFLMKFSKTFGSSLIVDTSRFEQLGVDQKCLINRSRSCLLDIVYIFNKFLRVKFSNDLKSHYSAYFKSNSRLFSNLIFHLSSYDEKIIDKFYHFDQSLVVDLLIVNNNWKNWIDLETENLIKTFNDKFGGIDNFNANSKDPTKSAGEKIYSETIMNKEMFDIDFNVVKMNLLKPTKISLNFSNLLKNVIDFNILTLKIPSIIKIKLLDSMIFKLLDLYYQKFQRLLLNSKFVNSNSSTNKYLNNLISESLNSFKRSEQSKNFSTKTQQDNILNEIKVLTKIYCSIKYLVIKLEGYNQHVEFIKLQNYLVENKDSEMFKHGCSVLQVDEYQLNDMLNSCLNSTIFSSKIDKLNGIIDEIVLAANNFLKKSLKVYLGKYIDLCSWKDEELDIDVDEWFDEDGDDEEDEGNNDIEELSESLPDRKSTESPFNRQIVTFEDFINYGFTTGNYALSNELQYPVNLLTEQLKFIKKCLGTSYYNTAKDIKRIEIQILENLKYYFLSYIIKINKFALKATSQLKYDYLSVVQRVLGSTVEDAIDFELLVKIKQQKYLVKILDCCHVLMINKQNIERVSGFKSFNKGIENLRNTQDFKMVRKLLSVRLLTDDEIYDLVSRIEGGGVVS